MAESHVHSKSLEETNQFASEFLQNLKTNLAGSLQGSQGATVVCLSGDLGSGKTALSKEIGGLLGVPRDRVTSPTFVIMNFYALSKSQYDLPFTHFIHIDAYRLEKADELLSLGWKEIVADPRNLIVIEWPEKVAEIISETAITIECTFVNETEREYKEIRNRK